MAQLYIPKKLKIGFQERAGTYCGKLAYVIYWDDKGKLRKETSWEGWRDKKIDVVELDNTPQSGLSLNKDIKRYNWSHFSSNRTLIRIYDPRGIEFEVTTENLIAILMHDDCSKRQLQSEYVFAWSGPELVLLPVCSEEYQAAKEFTALQGKKVSARDLVPGRSYKTKKEIDLVYLGRYNWYDLAAEGRYLYYRYGFESKNRKVKKHHIFTENDGKSFILKSSMDFLSCENSDEVVANYAEIMDRFKSNVHSQKVVDFNVEPYEFKGIFKKANRYSNYELERDVVYKYEDGKIKEFFLSIEDHFRYSGKIPDPKTQVYNIRKGYEFDPKTESTNSAEREVRNDRYYYGSRIAQNIYYTLDQLNHFGYGDLYVTLEDGRKIKTTLGKL